MSQCVCDSVFTRYLWLPLLGAILGAGIALAVSAISEANNPRFVASVPFQVLPPSEPITRENLPDLNKDDVPQVIHRQLFMFRQDAFLRDVLASAEFHPDDKPNRECAWLAANKLNPLRALKRDLVVVPDLDAASFEVRMTTPDPVESFTLVQAAVRTYLQRLSSDSQMRRAKYLLDLENAVQEKQKELDLKTAALVDYSKRNNLDTLKTSYEVEKSALTDLNREYTLADAAAKTAEERYRAIIIKVDGKEDIPLSSDLLQNIENDSTLRTLINTRLTLYQERAAAVYTQTTGRVASDRQVQEIDARVSEVDKQIKDTRDRLTKDARTRYVTLLHDESTNKRNLADYVKQIRMDKEDRVTHTAQNLVVWQQRVDEVKTAGDIVARLRTQLSLAQANRAVDDTRIAKIDDPVLPTTPAEFDWQAFQPQGILWAAVGLLAGLLVAWPLAAHRASRAQPNPAIPPAPPASPV
jgi:hypothetical protein